MNAFTKLGPRPPAMAGRRNLNDELGGGLVGGFSVVRFKGKEWTVSTGRDRKLITRNDVLGDGSPDPAGYIEVVIVRAATGLAKTYYARGYEEDNRDPPDCFSTNGITPDASAKNKQNAACGNCKWNAFGTAPSRDGLGGRGKACRDQKRLAIVPGRDVENERFGGPMLLNVPPDSLKELREYVDELNRQGYNYPEVVTRIGFESGIAHQRLKFSGVRVVDNREDQVVQAMRDTAKTQRIVNEMIEIEHDDTPKPMLATTVTQPKPEPEPNTSDIPEANEEWFKRAKQVEPSKPEPVKPEPAPEPAKPAAKKAKAAPPAEEEDEEAEIAKLQAEAAARIAEIKARKAAATQVTAEAVEAKATAKKEKKEPTATTAAPPSFDNMLDELSNMAQPRH